MRGEEGERERGIEQGRIGERRRTRSRKKRDFGDEGGKR
jgi:hypothetical protein